MKSRLLDAIRNLVPVLFYAIPVSVGADNRVDAVVPEGTSVQLSEFFSLESVLIVVFVLLVLAVIAHKTKSP